MVAYEQVTAQLNDRMGIIQAALERDQVRMEALYAEERTKQGLMNLVFGVLTVVAGASALVMSGGTMLPIVTSAFKYGAMALSMYGASNSIEAGQNIYYGLSGDGKSVAVNPIRDTLFLGNGELYHSLGQIFSLTTGVFIPITQTQSIAQGISQFFWGTVGSIATGQAAYHGTKLLGGNEETAQLMNLLGNFVGGYAASKAVKNFSLNGKTVPKVESALEIKNRVLENIKASKTARESSKFKQYIEKEGFQQTLNAMDPIDRQRYLQWHEYAEAGIGVKDRLKLMSWDRAIDSKLYLENKSVFDNPKYFNQETGSEIWPGQNGDPNVDGFLNGEYQKVVLQPGEKIDRFGSDYGHYFGKIGESKEMRSMSPNSDFGNYKQYEVLSELPVLKGKIAPWFEQIGGGTQSKLDPSFVELINAIPSDESAIIRKLIEYGYLRRL